MKTKVTIEIFVDRCPTEYLYHFPSETDPCTTERPWAAMTVHENVAQRTYAPGENVQDAVCMLLRKLIVFYDQASGAPSR